MIVYDYEGYGCSDGLAKNDVFFRDLMNVYIYAHQYYDGQNIFLFGDSCVNFFLSLAPSGERPDMSGRLPSVEGTQVQSLH